MQREIVTPQSDEYTVHIPKEYINTKVEILVLPFSYPSTVEEKTNSDDIFVKTAGILSGQNVDPLAWQDEMRQEWDR